MRWNIEGADVATGTDRLVTVDASTAEEAETIARKSGMVIAAVHRAKVVTPAERLEDMLAGTIDATTVTASREAAEHFATPKSSKSRSRRASGGRKQTLQVDAPPIQTPKADSESTEAATLSYRSAPTADVATSPLVRFVTRANAPDYLQLRIAGQVLFWLACVAYLAGALSVLATTWAFFNGLYLGGSGPGVLRSIVALLGEFWPLAIGGALHAGSAACAALRDIAYNSYEC